MVVAALFALYLLFGFLLVPVIVKQQLISRVHDATGCELSVERVAFNPLRLALTIAGLQLNEKSGESFAGWQRLYVNFEASSLFERAFTFAEIRLSKPRMQLRRLSADTFNFSSMLHAAETAKPPESAQPAEPSPPSLPGIIVQKLNVDQGELTYRDDTHPEAPVLKYLPIDFSLKAFSTRTQQQGQTQAELALIGAGGESLTWQGDLTLPVLASSGNIELHGFDIAALSRFADEWLPFHLARGQLAAKTRYQLSTRQEGGGQDFAIQLSAGSVTVADLAIANKARRDTAPIQIATIQVSGIGLDSATTRASIDLVGINGGRIDGTLAADGALDLVKLFSAAEATPSQQPAAAAPQQSVQLPTAPHQPPAPSVDPAAKSWSIALAKASVDDTRVQIVDQGPATPVTLTLDPLRIGVANFHSDSSQPLQLDVDAGVNGTGQLSVDGPVNLEPVQATMKIEAVNIPLSGFQPYISQAINIQLHSGVAGTVGTLTYPESGQTTGVSYQGDVTVDNLNTSDNRFNREFLSWKQLSLKNLLFEQSKNRASIDKIDLRQLYGRFAIRADGSTNIEKLLVPTPEPETPAPPLALTIGTVSVKDSAAYFADLSMNPDFRTGIFNLKGAITGIDSGGGGSADVDLVGQVDRYAPVTIKGKVNPFKATPSLDMKLAFKNLDMTTLTPYSGVYAGHRINQGQLSVDLDYQLDSDQVVGKNHIVMDQMELGERIDSPKAIDLPLRLALALLKDSRGIIDLGLEVQGNVNEPSFSVGGLIFTALKNLIVKAATAPFNLIAGLVGGENEQLDNIDFTAGSAQLDNGQKPKLDKLAKALGERPQLQLGITGNTLPEQDASALAERQLNRRLAAIAAGKDVDSAPPWPGLAAALGDKAFRKKYYALYETTTGESANTRRKIIDKAMTVEDNEPTDAAIDDALNEHIQHELLARETVTPKALARLAERRALAVKAYLADRGNIAPERVFLVNEGKTAQPALTAKLSLSAR